MRKIEINFYDEYKMNTSLRNDVKREYTQFGRWVELIIASMLTIFLLPLIILISICIKIDSKGPIFYMQERVGLNGKYFRIVKFRSMKIDAEINGPCWAKTNDNRITRVGSFIRKTRIDEIPQLINIIKGEMSFIGPRPERPMFTAQFNEEIPNFTARLVVKPGLTGWAQINGGYELSPKEKLKYDLYYVENRSLKLDFEILFKTFQVVMTGNGAR